jgi:lipopolysaccharide/colanic/teichoic acid biosynthesis glycosyltransferase
MTAVGPYRGKRILDLVLVVLLAVPAAILLGTAAIALAWSSRGPVLFRQERIGLDGQLFTLLKFQTMRHDPDRPFGFPDDLLVTPVGRVLRRTSLDELPQLWNVVKGDMSIVGPRPTVAEQVARYDERQRGRLAVRPGLTGLAQVRGRNTLSWPDRIDLDLEYVRTQSVGLDLRILASTVRVVVAGEGVAGHPTDDPIAAPDRTGS